MEVRKLVDTSWHRLHEIFLTLTAYLEILFVDWKTLHVLSATASLLPYLTIHMQSIGLTVEEIAIIYLALPFTTFIAPPITGWDNVVTFIWLRLRFEIWLEMIQDFYDVARWHQVLSQFYGLMSFIMLIRIWVSYWIKLNLIFISQRLSRR